MTRIILTLDFHEGLVPIQNLCNSLALIPQTVIPAGCVSLSPSVLIGDGNPEFEAFIDPRLRHSGMTNLNYYKFFLQDRWVIER